MDFVYTNQYPVTALHTDCFGQCRPSFLLRMSQDAAEEQLDALKKLGAKNWFLRSWAEDYPLI